MADTTSAYEWNALVEMELRPASGDLAKYEWSAIPEGNIHVTSAPSVTTPPLRSLLGVGV